MLYLHTAIVSPGVLMVPQIVKGYVASGNVVCFGLSRLLRMQSRASCHHVIVTSYRSSGTALALVVGHLTSSLSST